MATNKKFSFGALANYGNSTAPAATNFQKAFVTDCKKFVAKCGYPSKDEIGIMDEKVSEVDVTNTVTQIPQLISGFMKDEQRSFDLPAPDDNTAPATIKVVAVEEKTTEGVQTMGPNAGEKWTSTIGAHEEPKLKVNRTQFKK